MRFLIVDDSRAIQTIVRRALQKIGIPDVEFQTAADGLEALKVIETWNPDMVLTDWHMPGMSGIELLQQIRQRNRLDLKVAFITTETALANLAEAKALGALFFIHKPFEDEELARLVTGALGLPGKPADIRVVVAGLADVTAVLEPALERKVAITVLPKEGADEIHLPSAVGLYAFEGGNDIRALCLLDAKAVVLVGTAASSMGLPEIGRAMEAAEPDKRIWDQALLMLEREVPRLYSSSDGRRLRMLKTQLLKQQPAQLREIMKRSPCRNDFALKRGNLAVGQLTLISK